MPEMPSIDKTKIYIIERKSAVQSDIIMGNKAIPAAAPIQLESLKTESFEYVAATKDGMCWDAPLPCVQSELKGIKLKDKDSGIPGGFIKTDIQ